MLVKKLIDENLLLAEAKEFGAGDALFLAGDPADKFYFLESGTVHLRSPGNLSAARQVSVGGIISLHNLVKPVYAHSAYAQEATVTYEITREHLLQMFQLNPALRLYFLKLLGRGIAHFQPVYE